MKLKSSMLTCSVISVGQFVAAEPSTFMYVEEDSRYERSFDLSLLCSSTTVPFIHESHPHPLLYLKEGKFDPDNPKSCHNCGNRAQNVGLGCIKCNYFLDFRCATLPITVRLHKYDAHPLTLCYGEKASGKYWCDICERETNPETWFYTCNDCGVTLHIFCVLGNFRYARPGGKNRYGVELVVNNTSSRPICNNCHCRCMAPFFLIWKKETFCSYYCVLRIQMIASHINKTVTCPPWVDEFQQRYNFWELEDGRVN